VQSILVKRENPGSRCNKDVKRARQHSIVLFLALDFISFMTEKAKQDKVVFPTLT